jgi:hypothetical protein
MQVRILSPKEIKAEKQAEIRIICQGVSKEEFSDLYQLLEQVGCQVSIRNPCAPQFDPKAVHEIAALVLTGKVIGLYASKKAIDAVKEMIVSWFKVKFLRKSDHPKQVKISSSKGKAYTVKAKSSKKQTTNAATQKRNKS